MLEQLPPLQRHSLHNQLRAVCVLMCLHGQRKGFRREWSAGTNRSWMLIAELGARPKQGTPGGRETAEPLTKRCWKMNTLTQRNAACLQRHHASKLQVLVRQCWTEAWAVLTVSQQLLTRCLSWAQHSLRQPLGFCNFGAVVGRY